MVCRLDGLMPPHAPDGARWGWRPKSRVCREKIYIDARGHGPGTNWGICMIFHGLPLGKSFSEEDDPSNGRRRKRAINSFEPKPADAALYCGWYYPGGHILHPRHSHGALGPPLPGILASDEARTLHQTPVRRSVSRAVRGWAGGELGPVVEPT